MIRHVSSLKSRNLIDRELSPPEDVDLTLTEPALLAEDGVRRIGMVLASYVPTVE
jgi:hypothetical protein